MDIPPDLLQLRVDFLRADQRCNQLADALPSARDIINGLAEITPAQADELKAARAERLDIVMDIHRHAWWGTIPAGDQAGARNALHEAALQALSVNA